MKETIKSKPETIQMWKGTLANSPQLRSPPSRDLIVKFALAIASLDRYSLGWKLVDMIFWVLYGYGEPTFPRGQEYEWIQRRRGIDPDVKERQFRQLARAGVDKAPILFQYRADIAKEVEARYNNQRRDEIWQVFTHQQSERTIWRPIVRAVVGLYEERQSMPLLRHREHSTARFPWEESNEKEA